MDVHHGGKISSLGHFIISTITTDLITGNYKYQ
jgi:hypothetical protein